VRREEKEENGRKMFQDIDQLFDLLRGKGKKRLNNGTRPRGEREVKMGYLLWGNVVVSISERKELPKNPAGREKSSAAKGEGGEPQSPGKRKR